MVVVGGSIPLAPIQKIGRAASRKLLAESFRGCSLTSAFGLVSVPELEIGAAPADMPNSGQSRTVEIRVDTRRLQPSMIARSYGSWRKA
jgi:hypothetical protein